MKIKGNFAFWSPFAILLIGGIAYIFLLPKDGGKLLPKESFYLGIENAIYLLRNPNTILLVLKNMDGLQLFWLIWWFSFIISLFFFCRRLHLKRGLCDTNAVLTKREPYLIIQSVRVALLEIKEKKDSKELDQVIYKVKCLEEKLSVESDFGYGDKFVIDCENRIAEHIQSLLEIALTTNAYSFDSNIRILKTALLKIDFLLHRRTELKKKL